MRDLGRSTRVIAGLMAAVLAGGGGCVSQSYRIPSSELQRLSQIAPEQRGERVRVIQEISESNAPPAERIDGNTEVVFVPNLHVSTGVRLGGRGGGGGRLGSGGKIGGAGNDGKAAAIAFLVVAATALVVVAAIEGSRFDGWARLHPMHPVHLFGHDGSYQMRPLAWVDPQTVAWTDKAIVRPREGPWLALDRAPLTRTGLTYGMYGGSGSLRSVNGEKELGPAFSVQFGYFPTQQLGVLANVFFGWRDNVVDEVLFESRYTLELQAFPVEAGPFHAGFYGGAGFAYRFEDGTKLRNTNEHGSTALTGGAMLQLELHTRIALTARFGLARAHGERMSDILVGLSVY